MDTGAVHVGAGLGLAVVDVFPRHDADRCVPRWRPWKTEHQIVLRAANPDSTEEERVVQEILEASRTLMRRGALPRTP